MSFFKKIFPGKPTKSNTEKEDEVDGFTFNQRGEIKGTYKLNINGEEISIPINTSVDELNKKSERSENPNSCEREPTNNEVKVPVDGFLNKYQSSIPRHVFDNMQIAFLEGYNNFLINKYDFKIMVEDSERYKEFQDTLFKTVELNNKGRSFEKQGEIQSAINTYEENIKIGYPATNSYDRLIVLYRRIKKPHDELRVIERIIEVFNEEKKKRFHLVMDSVSESVKVHVQRCYEQNKQLRDNFGNIIFTPYNIDLDKYLKRREKVINGLNL